jgi:hypothetical protein
MSGVVAVCLAIVAVALLVFGTCRVMYERGYVHGYEDATHPDDVAFKEDDA